MANDMTPSKQTEEAMPPQTAFVIPTTWGVGAEVGAFLTSYDFTDKAEKRQLINAINEGGENPADWINRPILVKHVTYFPMEFTSKEDGELIRTVSTVLTLVDGKRIQFKSPLVIRSIQLIARLEGPPPWPEGKHLEIRRVPCADNKSFYRIVLLDDDSPVTPVAKKPK